jgi:hypothetical protein
MTNFPIKYFTKKKYKTKVFGIFFPKTNTEKFITNLNLTCRHETITIYYLTFKLSQNYDKRFK